MSIKAWCLIVFLMDVCLAAFLLLVHGLRTM